MEWNPSKCQAFPIEGIVIVNHDLRLRSIPSALPLKHLRWNGFHRKCLSISDGIHSIESTDFKWNPFHFNHNSKYTIAATLLKIPNLLPFDVCRHAAKAVAKMIRDFACRNFEIWYPTMCQTCCQTKSLPSSKLTHLIWREMNALPATCLVSWNKRLHRKYS